MGNLENKYVRAVSFHLETTNGYLRFETREESLIPQDYLTLNLSPLIVNFYIG